LGRFLCRKQSQARVLASQGVVACQQAGMTSADEITARIAYVGHGRTVVPQGAGY
jgi:hypothetical protein